MSSDGGGVGKADEILAEVYQRLEKGDKKFKYKHDDLGTLISSNFQSRVTGGDCADDRNHNQAKDEKFEKPSSTISLKRKEQTGQSKKQIVIGSLTEQTKTILSKQDEEASGGRHRSKKLLHSTEDGELMRSDASSEDDDDPDDTGDMVEIDTDGEINESDEERRRKRKKKRKHKHRSTTDAADNVDGHRQSLSKLSKRARSSHSHHHHRRRHENGAEDNNQVQPPATAESRDCEKSRDYKHSSTRDPTKSRDYASSRDRRDSSRDYAQPHAAASSRDVKSRDFAPPRDVTSRDYVQQSRDYAPPYQKSSRDHHHAGRAQSSQRLRRPPSPPASVSRSRDRQSMAPPAVTRSRPPPPFDERLKRYRTDRSMSRERHRRERESNARYRRNRSVDGSRDRRDRSRSRQRGGGTDSNVSGRINKKELLEIARRNASAMLQQGTLQQICAMGNEEIAKLKSGGTSVDELVDYCKKLQNKREKLEKKKAKREKGGNDNSSSSSSSRSNSPGPSEDTKFHHPFALNPQRNNIVFNIKNMTQLPPKTPAERMLDETKLKTTFPVSSGQQHRTKELEWRPVSPTPAAAANTVEKKKPAAIAAAVKDTAAADSGSAPTSEIPLPIPLPPPPLPPPTAAVIGVTPPRDILTPVTTTSTPVTAEDKDCVFKPPADNAQVDIGEVVATRLKAIRRLYDNPTDAEALKMMHFAEEQMRKWAESKNVPGAFLGGTGAQCLTPEQLAPNNPGFSAWAKKDQLINAKPVDGGVGMALLKKMGWKPGEGLGKNKEGSLKPLMLDVKSDRKGLVSNEELVKKSGPRPQSLLKMTAGPGGAMQMHPGAMGPMVPGPGYYGHGKHPVSVLMELCAKRRWGPPSFTCLEQGPFHNRRFLWKVLINGVEYQPATPCNNKKSAKTQAAQVALQSLGLAPRNSTLPVIIG